MNKLIVDSLQEKKYDDTFRYCFLLHRGPNDIEKGIVLHADHLYLLIKHSVQHVTISSVSFVLPTY